MLTKHQQLIHRRTALTARVVEIKPVIEKRGKQELHTSRYRMSGSNEFYTEAQVLKLYDLVDVKETA